MSQKIHVIREGDGRIALEFSSGKRRVLLSEGDCMQLSHALRRVACNCTALVVLTESSNHTSLLMTLEQADKWGR